MPQFARHKFSIDFEIFLKFTDIVKNLGLPYATFPCKNSRTWRWIDWKFSGWVSTFFYHFDFFFFSLHDKEVQRIARRLSNRHMDSRYLLMGTSCQFSVYWCLYFSSANTLKGRHYWHVESWSSPVVVRFFTNDNFRGIYYAKYYAGWRDGLNKFAPRFTPGKTAHWVSKLKWNEMI